MGGKQLRWLPSVKLARSVAVVGLTAAVAAAFLPGSVISQTWRAWSSRSHPNPPNDYGTNIRLLTERNRVDVYDLRRDPTLVKSVTVDGLHDLSAHYLNRPGEKSVGFVLRSGEAADAKTLVRLNLDSPSDACVVDARWPNLYEAESGSRLNWTFGNVVQTGPSGFSIRSASLNDSSDLPALSSANPIRIVIRPDMSSPLWNWDHRTAMRGANGKHYLSAFPKLAVSSAELTAAIRRNPPCD